MTTIVVRLQSESPTSSSRSAAVSSIRARLVRRHIGVQRPGLHRDGQVARRPAPELSSTPGAPLSNRCGWRLGMGDPQRTRHLAAGCLGTPGTGCIRTSRMTVAAWPSPETSRWQRRVNDPPRAAQRCARTTVCPSLCRIRLSQVKGAGSRRCRAAAFPPRSASGPLGGDGCDSCSGGFAQHVSREVAQEWPIADVRPERPRSTGESPGASAGPPLREAIPPACSRSSDADHCL